jgi:ankyrin repeat protein
VAEYLVSNGANADAGVHAAAATGREDLLRLLLRSGGSAQKALMGAAEAGSLETGKIAIDHGAQPSIGLKLAAEFGNSELARLMVARGASPNDGLYEACRTGHVGVLRLLMGLPGCEVGNPEHKALFGAAENGYEALLSELLSKNSPEQSQEAKDDAIRRAAERGHMSCVRLLIDKGADANVAIVGAASSAYWSVLSALLTKDGDSSLALYHASKYGHGELVTLLLDAGADPKSGISGAAQHGQSVALLMILDRFPQLATYACQRLCRAGHLGLVRTLLSSTYQIDLAACLNDACACNRRDIVEFLLDRVPGINARDGIYAAARGGNLEICSLLIEKGASIDEALEIASKSDHVTLYIRLHELKEKK